MSVGEHNGHVGAEYEGEHEHEHEAPETLTCCIEQFATPFQMAKFIFYFISVSLLSSYIRSTPPFVLNCAAMAQKRPICHSCKRVSNTIAVP